MLYYKKKSVVLKVYLFFLSLLRRFVAKQLASIKLDMNFLKNKLSCSKNFNITFPLKSLEELMEMSKKAEEDQEFAENLVRLQFNICVFSTI